jgi:Putative prokaryotic signal transducing protein
LVELCSPESEGEIAVLRSLLADAAILFFVENDNLGSMLAGPRIASYNRKRILVHEEDLEEARGLLEIAPRSTTQETLPRRPYSALDKARMVAEFLLFGWFLPGRRRRPGPALRLIQGGRDEPPPSGSGCGPD